MQFIKGQDIYGVPIGVHFQGEDTFKTWLGAFFTIGLYAFVMQNLFVLLTAFDDGSQQKANTSVIKFDRFGSDPYNLADNGLSFYLFPYNYIDVYDDYGVTNQLRQLPQRIGSYWLAQFQACDEGDNECLESEEGYQAHWMEFQNCTQEVTDELTTYYTNRNKGLGGFAETAQCVKNDTLFIKGDPYAYSTQANLEMYFVACGERDGRYDGECAPDEEIEEWLSYSHVDIVIDGEQVVMANRTEAIQKTRELYQYTLEY